MSSKIFDYMSFGKPIIHFYFNDNDVNVPWLKHYNNAFCIKISNNTKNDLSKHIGLFILSRSGRVDYSCFNDIELMKCRPEYVAQFIL